MFSQFYAAPLRLNPAFAGISVAPRVTANYRRQYGGWPNAYDTYAVSYEQPFEGKPHSIGLSAMADVQADGAYRNNYFSVVYSYDVRLNEEFGARLGLSAGILQSQVDFNRLIFGDVVTAEDGFTGELTEEMLVASSKTSFDANMGVLFYGSNLYGGISIDHINRPDESLLEINPSLTVGRPSRLNIHAGGQIKLRRYTNRRRPAYVSPSVLYSQQADHRQLTFGAYWGWGPLFLGSYYRHAFGNADALIGLFGVREGIFRIGYSYDATVSALRSAPGGLGGVHEIGISIDFGDSELLRRKRFKSRFSDCFGMFN